VVVRSQSTNILVDTSPDLRAQMLRHPVERLDGIIFTHAHSDHTAGLDELRRFNYLQQEHLPVWANASTLSDITRRFDYVFNDTYPVYGVIPDLTLHEIATEPFFVGDIEVTPVPVMHGRLPILGYRFGSIAYLTDVKTIPEASMPLLEGLDVLILTALRRAPHPAHLSLDEALGVAELIQPRHTLFTHVAHDMGRYEEVAPVLPEGFDLASDGLRVIVDPDLDDADRVSIELTSNPLRSHQ